MGFDILAYSVGALLYMPAFEENVIGKLNRYKNIRSIAFCLEDTINDNCLEKAEDCLKNTLSEIKHNISLLDRKLMIFIRVRTPEHINKLIKKFGDLMDIVTGVILPKFEERNAEKYLSSIQLYNMQSEHKLLAMPILESCDIADRINRAAKLNKLKLIIDKYSDIVLNIRVGGNDLCNLYRVRRPVNRTIYDIGVVRDILIDILNVFASDYVVSGPVWEYYGKDNSGDWAVGLKEETELDKLNGFIGKTVIHPSQISIVEQCMKVSYKDYADAHEIINYGSEETAVKGSWDNSRMNEIKCHSRWAERVIMLANIYGINGGLNYDDIRIAKRYKNDKRSYLLVNAIQAKHIPVSPSVSLEMMNVLGAKLAEKYRDTSIVVGFAETATAIGAVVASCMPEGCTFIHTTREMLNSGEKSVDFLEEHSHAVNQRIYGGDLFEKNEGTVIFVDDELTTGKTLINIIEQLRKEYKGLNSTRIVAASLINRLSDKNIQLMSKHGIICESLLGSRESDPADTVADIDVKGASYADGISDNYIDVGVKARLNDPRLGCNMREYQKQCVNMADEVYNTIKSDLQGVRSLLVLGTEECMYPAIIFGRKVESERYDVSVYTHSTTRSPIGIKNTKGYPITSGYRLDSFYDSERATYIYNLKYYDAAVIITDSSYDCTSAMDKLCCLLSRYKIKKIFFVRSN